MAFDVRSCPRWVVAWSVGTALGAFGVGCADLPTIQSGVCGNHVVEPGAGEDCDGFATEPGTKCRPPGADKACRFECTPGDSSSGPHCPSGLACGSDSICRSSSGKYVAAGAFGVEGARSVDVGDVDGDRRKDAVVFQRASVVAEYFDVAGHAAASLTMPAASEKGVAPVVGHLSTGVPDDVVLGTGVGVVAALGNADRRAEYTAYPTFTLRAGVTDARVVPADVFANPVGDEELVIGTLGGASGLVYLDGTTGQLTLLQVVPGSGSDLAGEVAKGRLGGDATAPPCDALVLSYTRAADVLVFHPCKRDSSGASVLNVMGPIAHVALPDGATVTRAATLADANGDGRLDLVVPASSGSGSIIAVAYGVGDGTFHSDPGSLPAASGDERASTYAELGPTNVLAVADLDADGLLDYVSDTGIYLKRPVAPGTSSSSGYVLQGVNAATPWTEVLVGDFNANGHLDVVAGSDTGLEIDFFGGEGDGSFTPAGILLASPVSHFTAGDFDGDFVQDIAVVQEPSPEEASASASNSLAILFGRTQGLPEPLVGMGRIGAAKHLVKTRVGQQDNVVPATDNLVAVVAGDDGSILFDGFTGQANRQIRSPYVLADTGGNQSDIATVQIERFQPILVALGDYDGDGHLDVAELGEDLGRHRLWLVPVKGDSEFATAAATDGDLLPAEADFDHALVGAEDLDGDGIDELVLFAPNASDSGKGLAYVARALPNANGQRKWVLDPPVDQTATFDRHETPEGITGASLRSGDVDGDGRPDLLVPTAPGPGERLLLFPNDGSGNLTAPIEVGGSSGAAAFTLLDADSRKGLDVAVLIGSDVFLLGRGRDGQFTRSDEPVASLAGAGFVASGDFNGDGLDDLVLVSDRSLTLFTAVPVLP